MIARSKPMRRISPKKKARSGKPGKLGIVRLTGDDMQRLREECFDRDQGTCQECGVYVVWDAAYDGDPRAYHLAHIKSRGAGGSDVLENVRVLCASCHIKEHAGQH